jgi:hypothetical protein
LLAALGLITDFSALAQSLPSSVSGRGAKEKNFQLLFFV